MSPDSRPGLVLRLATAALCGAAFILAYGGTNALAHASGVSANGFLPIDHAVPFIPWTIVPYWSLDLLFVTAFLVQKTHADLSRHTARTLLGIGVAAACFIVFPLRCGAERPEVPGVLAPWFRALGGVDMPYNQAPSLHIILLLLVWHAHLPATPKRLRPLAYAWGALIGVSTLTTRQHGVIDLVAGLLVGALLVYGIRAEPWLRRDGAGSPKLAAAYAGATSAIAAAAVAIAQKSALGALTLGWCATGTALIALAYRLGCTGVYAKQGGRVHWSAKLTLGPALLFQKLAHRILVRRMPPAPAMSRTGQTVTFGPVSVKPPPGAALLDLTAEHDTAGFDAERRAQLPMLDLVTPDAATLSHAADLVRTLGETGPVHIVCALGLERSALATAAWHLRHGDARSPAEAITRVRTLRPQALPHPEKTGALAAIPRMAPPNPVHP